MDRVELKYGGGTLIMRKSQTLAGIRPSRGRSPEAARATRAMNAELLPRPIGGFQIIDAAHAVKPVEETLDTLRADPAVDAGTHVYTTSDDEVPFVPTGDIYLVFSKDAPLDQCQALLDQHRLEVREAQDERTLTVRITPASPNPLKVAAALQQSPYVEVAEPDLATPGQLLAFAIPSDTLLERQWHLRNTGTIGGASFNLKAGADARVVSAWQRAQTLGSPQVVVAVIDDGFDLDHPDLGGPNKVVAPWDFTRNSNDPRPELNPDYPFLDEDTGRWQGDWHGTACAGVAVGNANGSGVVGASPACRLMSLRWGRQLSSAQVTRWFDYARTQGASVVSCSWGAKARVFPLSTQIRTSIERCANEGRQGKGCVICFAAGNEDRDIQAPDGSSLNGFAIHPSVIAVAACSSRDQRADYSNYGAAISVCAPSSGAGGWDITTTDVRNTFQRNGVTIEAGYSAGDFTSDFGGTSSATPLVAGICALLLSIDRSLTSLQVKTLLERTARKIGDSSSYTNGHSRDFGYGCVDADSAVKALLST